MSAEGRRVIDKFAEVMTELATTDADAWDLDEVVGFADGIHIIDGIMQGVVQQRTANAG